MAVSAGDVKLLRDKTGCGMMDCKSALTDAGGDFDKAVGILRRKGLADLAKRADRAAKEGMVAAYIHGGGRIGVMVEVNCETDFVAKNADFQRFAHDIAMQIAASAPIYVSRFDVPEEVIEAEKSIYRDQVAGQGKPEKVVDKIIEGKLEKYYETVCLMDQLFVKNPDVKIGEYLGELASKIGENLGVRRFTRYLLGEE